MTRPRHATNGSWVLGSSLKRVSVGVKTSQRTNGQALRGFLTRMLEWWQSLTRVTGHCGRFLTQAETGVTVCRDLMFGLPDQLVINDHSAEASRVGSNTVLGKRGPKDGNKSAGDLIAEGCADCSRAVVWNPVACVESYYEGPPEFFPSLSTYLEQHGFLLSCGMSHPAGLC